MNIIGVDPGKATGIALYLDGRFDSRQTDSYEETVKTLGNVLDRHEIDALVCERFVVNATTHKKDPTAFPITMDLVGACRLLCHQYGIEFVANVPADKSFGTDDKLKRLGWWKKGSKGHDNDAARHVLHYLVKQRHEPVLRALTQQGA